MLATVDQRDMRAADVDRERVANRLRDALNEGRLTLDEFDERLRETYAAKTYRELDRQLSDLPGTVPVERSQVVPAAEPATAPPHAVRDWLVETWRPWLFANAVCVAIWTGILVLSGPTAFWPAFVAVPWGLVLGVVTVFGLAGGEPYRWARKREKKRKRRAADDHDVD